MTLPKQTGFSRRLIEENGLVEHGFVEWLLYPGMLFRATEAWWGEGGRRETAHEGLDLCYYRDQEGTVFSLGKGASIPVMYDGAVAAILDDFLGSSLIVRHHIRDDKGSELCSIYGHTTPRDDIRVGRAVEEGEIIGTVAGADRSKSDTVPHLHISIGWTTGTTPYEKLDWNVIGDPDVITLIDPLQVIGRYHTLAPA
jgi:murein DD-endopeptidase MepM/ murein hydrolase activator NlpD